MFIKTIHSRNGDIVTCSNSITPLATKKEFPLDAENNWTYIEIIYDKSPEMSGWKNVGPLAVRFTGDFKTSGDDLEKNCLIILKKKAVRLNADIIHITEKKIFREYGELPKIEMRAVAYIKE